MKLVQITGGYLNSNFVIENILKGHDFVNVYFKKINDNDPDFDRGHYRYVYHY